jgi:hypothetical protein
MRNASSVLISNSFFFAVAYAGGDLAGRFAKIFRIESRHFFTLTLPLPKFAIGIRQEFHVACRAK